MAEATTSDPGSRSEANQHISGVARGGAANLVGAGIYGLSNFVLLVVLNRGLGLADAGVVIVAIAIFNILAIIGGLGAATGLVRFISRMRTQGNHAQLPGLIRVALVPVTLVSAAAGLALWVTAPWLAELFADGDKVDRVTGVLHALAPFVPFATLQSVVVQATRGFDTMTHQVVIEKISRSIAMPLAAAVAIAFGAGPRGASVAWAATNAVALIWSAQALRTLLRRDLAALNAAPVAIDRETSRGFWGFTGPRALAQTFDVAINWFDTIVVGAILSTTKAGIYASGTRYLLPGLFAADAMLQVTSPKLSAMLTKGRTREASELVQVVAGWQVAVMWPIYLLVMLFPNTLLGVFGAEVVEARGALIALSAAMLFIAITGPTGAVIMMAGRSRQAMFNSLVGLVVNVAGNFLFVPQHGIMAAGAVWAVTLLAVQGLNTWQTNRTVGVRSFGRPALVAAAVAAASVGLVGLALRLALGDEAITLIAATAIGGSFYLIGVMRYRSVLHLDTWWSGLRGKQAVS